METPVKQFQIINPPLKMTLSFLLMTVCMTLLPMATWLGNLAAITENATIAEATAVMPWSGMQCYIIFWIAMLYLCLDCKFIPMSGMQCYT